MAHAAPTTEFKDIGQGLVDGRIITHDQLLVAQEARRNLGGNLGQILLKRGFVDRDQLLRFLSETLHIPVVKLNGHSLDPDLIKLVPASVAKKYQLIPLRREKDVLTVAMSDPLQIFALDEIRDAVKLEINPVLAETPEIERLQHDHYHEFSVGESHSDVEVLHYGVESAEEASERLKEMAAGAKVVAQVNSILQEAVVEGASDIHIEPQTVTLRVRTRVDGILEERMILPKSMHLPVLSRIKVMSGMDIAERRIPQDGRVRARVSGNEVDMRVSTYPTMYGEKAVIRLFRQGGILGLKELGLHDDERKRFEQLITKPHGILLVTGPTGSGKSTTLYAALGRINSQDKNIISIEDPIEHEVAGVSQAQVNVKAGMSFASALRSILRQDPDVIMVGEIRDRETADITIRAAITGHLVFSTLHTNTAIGAVTRLHDLGVEHFMTASAVIGLIAQRLIRCICPDCAEPATVDPEKRAALGVPPSAKVMRGRGCPTCRMSGYTGRIALFEVIVVTPELRRLIAHGAKEEELLAEAERSGTTTLRKRGLELILAGKTTVEEVLRVTEE